MVHVYLLFFFVFVFVFAYFVVNRAEEAAKRYRAEAGAKLHVAAKVSKAEAEKQKLAATLKTQGSKAEAEMQKLKAKNDKLTTRLHEDGALLRNMQQAMHDIVSCFNDKLDRVTNSRIVTPVGLAKALDLSPNSSEKVALYSGRGIWKSTKLLDATPTPNGKKLGNPNPQPQL